MKKAFYVLIVTGLGIYGCQNSTNKIQAFIPGIYVRAVSDEFTEGNDTVEIHLLDNGKASYQIQRRFSFMQHLGDKQLPFQRKTESWIGTFDDKTGLINISYKNKQLAFLPEERLLMIGRTQYFKLQ